MRLLAEFESSYREAGVTWAHDGAEAMRDQLRKGEFRGLLWVGPKDEAVGFAAWDEPKEVGRRVSFYLSEGFRAPGPLESFVSAVSAEAERAGSPVIAWFDVGPIMSLEAQRRVFGARGAFHVVRIDMTYPAEKPLFEPPGESPSGMRPLHGSDQAAIARLLEVAYDDNPVERAVFVRYRDPVRDAEESARDLLHDTYGRWMSEASFGVFDGDVLASAVLVNDLRGPLITEVMTAPGYRRRGLIRHLLRASVSALRTLGMPAPRLVVTTWNERAARLYRSLGFVHLPGADGGIWLDLPRLGVTAPQGPQHF
jgi:GNAT superfamily N-acetyltransferase